VLICGCIKIQKETVPNIWAMENMKLSVVICTYNPDYKILNRVLQSLQTQTLPVEQWELIVIDNNSHLPVETGLDISWHPHAKILKEPQPGLSYARLKGVNAAAAPLIVFVDDDNFLDNGYLEYSYKFYQDHPEVGCFGGKSFPLFETDPPSWFFKTGISLGCQDYGNETYISDFKKINYKISAYPPKAPIGTGMVITKKAFLQYYHDVKDNPGRLALGRKGNELTSGEDNDIILTIIKKGFEIAYTPELTVSHIIPAKRYSKDYLKKIVFESNRSWVKVLSLHNVCPWKKIQKWTYGFRVVKSYVYNHAWQSPVSLIKWKSSCGIFKGLSEI
jgi:glycosyltransferase involved in cell wall biosynthesis